MNSARIVSIRIRNIRPYVAAEACADRAGGNRRSRRAAADDLVRVRLRFTGDRGNAAHSRVGHDVTLGAQMSLTDWLQRPPEPAVDLTAGWSATPGTVADLTRLRHTLPALVGHRSGPAGDNADLDELLLVFEELASNGLRHGRPPVRVVVAALRTGWLVDVSDAAVERPPLSAHDRNPATGGLGLSLVAELSGAHGWTVNGNCKHIWARVDAESVMPRSQSHAIPAPRIPV
jgi:hypothetical protein